jgi:CubicO group peptidase (beta-lactamase class C family)
MLLISHVQPLHRACLKQGLDFAQMLRGFYQNFQKSRGKSNSNHARLVSEVESAYQSIQRRTRAMKSKAIKLKLIKLKAPKLKALKLKASLLAAVFALLIVASVRIASPAAFDDRADRIARVESGLLPAIMIKGKPAGMKITDRLAFYKTPGVSVAVINGGVIEWARGYGALEAGSNKPVTPETLFQAASISKPVAAMGALRLVEQGKLNLDEDANNKLTSWKIPASDFTKEQKVTLRRLLSHTAGMTVHGFRGYAIDEPLPTLLQILNGEKPANSAAIRVDVTPGSRWRYSGGGITVMQQMVIDVTGKPFPEYMKEAVLDRLAMTHSTYEQPLPEALSSQAATGHRGSGEAIKGKWHTYPEMAAAGLWTTPSDLARFAIELQKSRAGQSNKALSQAMTNQMMTVQSGDYGLGLGIRGSGKALNFSHGGSNEGFRCIMFAYAETGQGAVVMTNGDMGSPLADEILRSIAKEYGWPDYHAAERELARVDPKVYGAYAGQYQVMGAAVTVTAENGRLFIQAPPLGPDKVELYPESETKYFITLDDATFTFVKDEKGAVAEMLVQPPGNQPPMKAKKIK